jgi:hypothetical protein
MCVCCAILGSRNVHHVSFAWGCLSAPGHLPQLCTLANCNGKGDGDTVFATTACCRGQLR